MGSETKNHDSIKLVLIGAGSAMFTRGLVADMILATDMGPWELGLVDTDPQALEVATSLSEHMVKTRGAPISVDASTNRRDVLPNADAVVCTIGVGGRRAWEDDVFIPRKYGIYQPVGDTVMPGGISRAQRMIPAMVDIAYDVAELCPDAWFFNYSNPMTANCAAVRKVTGLNIVGLCHGTFHVQRQLASYIGAPPDEVTALFIGLNHLTFIFDLRWGGRDLWPQIREKIARERVEPPPEGSFYTENPFSWSLFERYGAYPSANDRHVVEFFPERFPGGRYYGKTLGVDAYSFENTISNGDRIYDEMRAQALGEQPVDESIFHRASGEHEQLLNIIAALRSDRRDVFAVNLPNKGTIPDLPAEAVLECPAVATATGLHAMRIPEPTPSLSAILTRKLSSTALTVESALTGDRSLFCEALLFDGAVTDMEVAQELGNELLETHRRYLPNYYPEG
jgi:alpha-galactosidase